MNKFCSYVIATSFLVPFTIIGVTLNPEKAEAIGYWDTVKRKAVVVIDTALGNLTAEQEAEKIKAIDREYNNHKKQASVGGARKNGLVVAKYTLADLGSVETLTYIPIDPTTGLRTQTPLPFTFSSVRYDALLEPFTLDADQLNETSIRANLVTIGVSSDAANDFAVPFILQGFEPMILAFPLDANGNEVTGEFGLDGIAGSASNVLSTPEPTSTLSLLALGTLGAASTLKRKLKSSKSSEKETTKVS